MGISKLTTYMEDKESGPPEAIWEQVYLCNISSSMQLVIDGNNLCFWLYRSNTNLQDTVSMGGSYPTFYEVVVRFFETLTRDYKIQPIVVFDGVKRDNKTSRKRRNEAFATVSKYQKGIYKGSSGLPLPLMMKVVFLDALQSERVSGASVHFVGGEADAEIVAIANSLDCPVLSGDSDFYIYNITGGFIPLQGLQISNHGELQSPEVGVFLVNRFTTHFKLKDEDLRLLIPAILGNDKIPSLLTSLPELQLQLSTESGMVSQVIRYARSFDSLQMCLEAARGSSPALFSNIRQAQEQYLHLPSPSYPLDPCSLVPERLSLLQPYQRERFHQGCFQTFMADAVATGKCFFRTIFDDIRSEGAQCVSKPTREVIYQILGCVSPIHELRRGETHLAEIPVEFDGRPPITADRIPCRTVEKRRSILLSILQCDQALLTELDEVWQLPVAATIYWYTQTDCKPAAVKALVASFVACNSGAIPSQRAPLSPPTEGTPELSLVHFLAQWQCIYFDVVALNQLLMEPFQYVSPAKLFDGEVALFFHNQKHIDQVLQLEHYNVHLYHKLLDMVIFEEPTKRKSKPAKKAGVSTSLPTAPNRFAALAKMKDRKQ